MSRHQNRGKNRRTYNKTFGNERKFQAFESGSK